MSKLEESSRALAVGVQARLAMIIWGPPGTGKTSALVALGEALGWHVEVVIGSIREATDIAGLPVRKGDGVALDPPSWALRILDADRAGRSSLLVLDELTTSPAPVQAAMLRVTCERVVGELALPETTSIVAAANPPELAADGYDLAAPLANRFCHLDWPLDARAWSSGMTAGWPNPHPMTLDATWGRAVTSWRAKVAGFIAARPELLFGLPDDLAARGRAWPSPRTWEMAARAAAAGSRADPTGTLTLTLVAGCVGQGPALELLSWVARADLPDAETILDAPGTLDLPMRGDRLHATLAGVVAAVAAEATRPRWDGAWAAICRVADHGQADIASLAAKDLLGLRDDSWPLPTCIDIFAPILELAGALE